MPAPDVAALARRWFEEVWNERREATIDELMQPDGICFADQGELRGSETFRLQQYAPLVGAFPNLHITVDDVLGVADQAVVRWTAKGTHLGPQLGFEPTGKTVTIHGMTWIRARDGKFSEGWQSSNIFEVIRSLRSE